MHAQGCVCVCVCKLGAEKDRRMRGARSAGAPPLPVGTITPSAEMPPQRSNPPRARAIARERESGRRRDGGMGSKRSHKAGASKVPQASLRLTASNPLLPDTSKTRKRGRKLTTGKAAMDMVGLLLGIFRSNPLRLIHLKANNTLRSSRAVPHPSTYQALSA